MLTNLHISNYALIDSLSVSFDNGFSTITGETGAGKSILLGALSLILGQRADTSVIKDTSRNCVVEGTFDVRNYKLQQFFEQNDLDYEDVVLIRRVINPSGKSRAFINDLPTTLNVLKDLSNLLIDVHSQHNNLLIHDDLFQLDVVDSFAASQPLLGIYKAVYKEYRQAQKAYKELKEGAKQAAADLEFNRHRLDELQAANLHDGEDEELEAELNTLSHSEEIKANLSKAAHLLSGDGDNITSLLKNCTTSVEQVADYLSNGEELNERLNSSLIELTDLANEIEVIASDAEFDPERAQWVNDRLDLIYTLQKKHTVSSVSELLKVQADLSEKIGFTESLDFELEAALKKLEDSQKALAKAAGELTKHRQAYTVAIEKKIIETLVELGMPNTQFKVDVAELPEYSPNGKDSIRFQFSANKNIPLQDISKVASGGEISRLMLSIKWLLSHSKSLPTIIFDEIDTGISGDIADKMGSIMQDMSKSMQVISITHLPQIAGKGSQHYRVFKEDKDGYTTTMVKKLAEKERVNEIAKMLSGRELTSAALENAKNLLTQ